MQLSGSSMADVGVGNLEEEALKRKQRLNALKRKHDLPDKYSDENSESPSNQTNLPKPKFRSYKPQDEGLKENVLSDAKPSNVEAEVQNQLELAKSKVLIEELDISNLAPRKPDWDLKRDVAKKLERLEKRTQKAIAELIRDRLKEEATDMDLARKVAVGATLDAAQDD